MSPMAHPLLSKKRKSGIPTGNAGEYFVMGEFLRRGFDAQLADRNTKGYDLLVGQPGDPTLRKVQVKTVRSAPWYVRLTDFEKFPDRTTVYVLLAREDGRKPVRFFIAENEDLAQRVDRRWEPQGFMPMRAVDQYEDRWEALLRVKHLPPGQRRRISTQ